MTDKNEKQRGNKNNVIQQCPQSSDIAENPWVNVYNKAHLVKKLSNGNSLTIENSDLLLTAD
jgi:hypothetical protein